MPILADLVQVVIGVDTHNHTRIAAVLTAATGQILATHTVPTTPAGYETPRTLADRHPGLRIWAIEGTGGYGAGLVQLLAAHDEWVVELDRPARPARRHGAKSDALDAVRAAREALEQKRPPTACGPPPKRGLVPVSPLSDLRFLCYWW